MARAARLVQAGGATVALSVLADSAVEHYRGAFRNPAMTLPLVASAAELVAWRPGPRGAVHAGSVAIGLTGLGFHIFNIGKRVGGFSFTNLFYGAPIGAPGALVIAGVLGAMGDALERPDARLGPAPLGSGRVLAGFVAFGIAGSVGEAALLHFRGAYQNPYMWLPVTLPPLAAGHLARDAVAGEARGLTAGLLALTAALGIAGAGFHAYGVSRQMGGWRNWRQNLLDGPPIPAPPAFTGLAIAALGALMLMRGRDG